VAVDGDDDKYDNDLTTVVYCYKIWPPTRNTRSASIWKQSAKWNVNI